jgi:hypothetical protein
LLAPPGIKKESEGSEMRLSLPHSETCETTESVSTSAVVELSLFGLHAHRNGKLRKEKRKKNLAKLRCMCKPKK